MKAPDINGFADERQCSLMSLMRLAEPSSACLAFEMASIAAAHGSAAGATEEFFMARRRSKMLPLVRP